MKSAKYSQNFVAPYLGVIINMSEKVTCLNFTCTVWQYIHNYQWAFIHKHYVNISATEHCISRPNVLPNTSNCQMRAMLLLLLQSLFLLVYSTHCFHLFILFSIFMVVFIFGPFTIISIFFLDIEVYRIPTYKNIDIT